MAQLSIVRRGASNASPAAPATPAAPAPLSIVKRGGAPVQPDFRAETVEDHPDIGGDDWGWVRNAWDYVVGTAETLNPLPMVDALGRAVIPDALNQALGGQPGVTGPWQFAKGALKSHEATLDRARKAYADGDSGNAILHFTNWLVPLLGPGVDEAAYGDVEPALGAGTGQARRAGRVTGILGQLLIPPALRASAGARVPGLGMKNPALSAEDVAFAERGGIPLDAATATGSKTVRNLQAVADSSLSEALTRRGQTFREGQRAALQRTGERIADDVRPADWTPERAGAHLRRRLEERVGASRAEASDAYAKLREIEAEPANVARVVEKPEVVRQTSDGRRVVLQEAVVRDVPLAIDVSAAKAGLRGWYDDLVGRKERVGLAPDESRVLQALDRVMQSDATQALSEVDGTLSELKRLARGDGPPTRARAAALRAIGELEQALDARLDAAPPAVRRALQEGRAATRAKYEALDVLDALREEPVRAFRDLMAPGDASLRKLRAVQKFLGPEDLATLGRAWLQGELESVATGAHGWARMRANWNRVGAETRKIVLGRQPGLARDIDHLLRVAAEVEKNPNPSGTALTLWSAGQGGLLVTDVATGFKSVLGTAALSQFLYSPAGVRLLTRGLRVPRSNRLLSAAIAADVATMSERLGAPLTPLPASAGERDRRR